MEGELQIRYALSVTEGTLSGDAAASLPGREESSNEGLQQKQQCVQKQ